MRADLGDNWCAKGDVRYKMAVHDVDLNIMSHVICFHGEDDDYMKPVSALTDCVRASLAQGRKVGRED